MDVYAATVKRAKPSAGELISIFDRCIADGTLALCDELCNCHVFPEIADCVVEELQWLGQKSRHLNMLKK